ncbi:hypothetical protein [Nocardioides sp.]|uniref:hypothetical protein n=1 Tax=Nocardioides sp. TaxID=35761 RepID=UPI003566EE6D
MTPDPKPVEMPEVGPDPLAAAETWFLAHGLSYFVPEQRASARAALRPRRVLPLVLGVVLVASGAGGVLGWLSDQASVAPAVLVSVGLTAAAWYALTALNAAPIVRWALAKTFGSLRTVLSMSTRALPMLLIFITFLFINTEVWQVGSNLGVGVLWLTVLLFTVLALGFLLVRLPEEVDRTDDDVDDAFLLRACRGTPLEASCRALVADPDADPADHAEVQGFERWNLIVVLMVVQIVQVLLLALSVFAFLVVFGSLVMTEPVMESWLPEGTHGFAWSGGLTRELLQVSTFLAAFSGLYLTVSTVTDESYRAQFFSGVIRELERAVGMRAVYLAVRSERR